MSSKFKCLKCKDDKCQVFLCTKDNSERPFPLCDTCCSALQMKKGDKL